MTRTADMTSPEIPDAAVEAVRSALFEAFGTIADSYDLAYVALTAALPHLAAGRAEAVAVKPLEWASEPPYHIARVFNGHYAIEKWEGEKRFDLIGTFTRQTGAFTTLDAAKAAAQADFEQRIRSALVPAEAVAAGWQTMDTAPKDGSEILGIQIHNGRCSDPGIVQWDDFEQEWWDIDADQYGFPTHWTPKPGSALVSAPAAEAEPAGWQWNTLGTWHTVERPSCADPEKYARDMAGAYGQARPIWTAAPAAWLPWTGGLQPVPDDTPGHIRVADGEEFFSQDISSFNWSHDDVRGPVPDRRNVAYRSFYAAPSASQEALREAAQALADQWVHYRTRTTLNQQDAYWTLVKGQWGKWEALAAALAQSAPVKEGE